MQKINKRKLNCIYFSIQAHDFLDLSHKGLISQDGHNHFPPPLAKHIFYFLLKKCNQLPGQEEAGGR